MNCICYNFIKEINTGCLDLLEESFDQYTEIDLVRSKQTNKQISILKSKLNILYFFLPFTTGH